MSRIIDQSPNPKSHIKTLMRIGYTLNSAVADVIDNSITAGASSISIYAPPGLEDPVISILDDGCGMNLDELTQNMRIGCKDPSNKRNEGDLGRFGSGMKTASFSQARQLTVISRKRGQSLVAARWDIDKIEESNAWCLEVFEGDEVYALEGLSLDFPASNANMVVVLSPLIDFYSRLVQRSEPVRAQAFLAELAVEAFDERVLSRFSRLYKAKRDTRLL